MREFAPRNLAPAAIVVSWGLQHVIQAHAWVTTGAGREPDGSRAGDEVMVCVKSFWSRFEAEVAQSTLRAFGIESMVSADDCGGIRPYQLAGMGGVRLMVLGERLDEAREVLENPPPVIRPKSRRRLR